MTTWRIADDWRLWALSGCGSIANALRYAEWSHDFDAPTELIDTHPTAPLAILAVGGTYAPAGGSYFLAYQFCARDSALVADTVVRVRSIVSGKSGAHISTFARLNPAPPTLRYTAIFSRGDYLAIFLEDFAATFVVVALTAYTAIAAGTVVDLEFSIIGTSMTARLIRVSDGAVLLSASGSDSGLAAAGYWGVFATGISGYVSGPHDAMWLVSGSTAAAVATSPAVDLGGTDRTALLTWSEDLAAGGDVTFTVQQSADGATGWTTIAGASALTDPDGVLVVASQRYVRAVATLTRSLSTQEPRLLAVSLVHTPLTVTDTIGPALSPLGAATALSAIVLAVAVSRVSGEPGTTLRLQIRTLGSGDAWTTKASDATPAIGDLLLATGLFGVGPLEWRLVEDDASGNIADGSHGIAVPSVSIWPTLIATIQAALATMTAGTPTFYEGTQPPPNDAVITILLRTRPEVVRREGSGVAQVEYPVELDARMRETSDTGEQRTQDIATLQRDIVDAFDRRTATDYPGIPGLEQIAVEVEAKDDARRGAAEYDDETRCRTIVRFVVWEAR